MRHVWVLCALCALLTATAAFGRTLVSPGSAVPAHQVVQRHSSQFRAVRGDPMLFGDQRVQTGRAHSPSGSARAFRFKSGITGTVGSLSVYIALGSKAKTLVAGAYSSRGAHPHSLIGSASLSSPKTGAWDTVRVKPFAVKTGRSYWIAVLGRGGTLNLRYRGHGGQCTSEQSLKGKMRRLPASWKGRRVHGCQLSAYAGGTPSTSGGPPPTPAPQSSGLPKLSGEAAEGHMLTTTNGSWTNGPSSYSYGWEDCDSSGGGCSKIAGAGSSSYLLRASDVGHTIRSVVTAANAGGSGSASSAQSGVVTGQHGVAPPVPSNTALPIVSGPAIEGQMLNTTNGSWTNSPTAYTYAWEDCDGSGGACAKIGGATSSSYVLQASDVTRTIRSIVTAVNAGGPSTPAQSQSTSVVAGVPVPSIIAVPKVTGSAIQGQTLSTTPGSWSNSPTSYEYAWEDCDTSGGACSTIGGASSASYVLQGSDVGHTIRSVVTAHNASGPSAPAASAQSGVVASSGSSLVVGLPATGKTCSTRFSSQEVWPGTTTSLSPPGGGYPNVFQRIDSSKLDIWRVQAVDGYNDASTSLVSPSHYTDSMGATLTAWNFNTLDKQLSDGPTGATRELDMVHPPDALWTGTAPIGGDGSSQGTLADQTYGALASYEANVVKYFRTGILRSDSGPTVTYTPTSMTDTSVDFTAYGGGGYAITATVPDDNGFPDWETATITSVTNGGHTVNFAGWSTADSNALSTVSTPVAGAAYNLASVTPPVTSPALAHPWPRPPSVGNIGYLELFNEPDLSNSSYPRVSPSLPPPTPTLTGVNVPGGTLTPGTNYSYRIAAAAIDGGLSLPGTEVSIPLPSGDNAIRIDWSATSNLGLSPFAYQVFGRSAGGEQTMVTVGKDAAHGLTWTDDGSVAPSGPLPSTDDTPGKQLWRAHEYLRMWNVVAPAVRSVDPSIKLVGPTISNPISLAPGDVVTTDVTTGPDDHSWISNDDYVPVLMAGGSPKPDAVSIHNYGWFNGDSSTETQQWGGLNSGISDFISQDQAAVGTTPVFLDETNLDAGNFGNSPAPDLRAETQMGAAWLADSYVQWCARAPQMAQLMQYEVYNGDVAWGLFSDASYQGDTSCVPQPACQNLRASEPNLEYWMMRAMNDWLPAGSAVVPVSGVPPGLAAFAVESSANTVVLVVVNTQIGNSDGNGAPGTLNVQLSGGSASDVQKMTVDGSTDMLNGPSTVDLGAENTIPLSMAGYGVALLKFTLS
jgi:hypothetical protein